MTAQQEAHRPDPSAPGIQLLVKLGGAAITNKRQLETLNQDVLRTVAAHVADAWRQARSNAGGGSGGSSNSCGGRAAAARSSKHMRGSGGGAAAAAPSAAHTTTANAAATAVGTAAAEAAPAAAASAVAATVAAHPCIVVVHGAGSFGHLQALQHGVPHGWCRATLLAPHTTNPTEGNAAEGATPPRGAVPGRDADVGVAAGAGDATRRDCGCGGSSDGLPAGHACTHAEAGLGFAETRASVCRLNALVVDELVRGVGSVVCGKAG
eukprot:362555-Chlamydomonas_euryale.AAC.5